MSKNYNEYNDLGVRFIYPVNWFVRTETWDKGTYSITVDSPEGSFWSIAIYPKEVDLDSAAKEIVKTMHAEYDEIDETEIVRYVADRVLEGYEINFFYLDLTSTAIALKFEDERRGYVVFWQTCDRLSEASDQMTRSDIFDAMTHTLVSNLTGQEVEYWDDEDDEFHFGKKLSDREEREAENREFFRRKYEQARYDQDEENWRKGVDRYALPDGYSEDENDDERRRVAFASADEKLADFMRDVEREYGNTEPEEYGGFEDDEDEVEREWDDDEFDADDYLDDDDDDDLDDDEFDNEEEDEDEDAESK